MKSDAKPFRSFEVDEGHPIVSLSWSPSGDAFLAVTGSPQPKVYNREGKEQGQFVRGDMYIRDQKNTKGHVAGCTGGQWHPVDKLTAMTCSSDGTVRVWDMDQLVQKTVIKPQLAKPGRVQVTAACYGSTGHVVAAGLMDGTIQLWDVRGKFGRSAAIEQVAVPSQQMVARQDWNYVSSAHKIIRSAHVAGSEITCLALSRDGHQLISRGGDDTLKAWDTRSLKQPLAVFEDLDTTFANTQACFSPDERLILTGTSARKADAGGSVIMFDRRELKMVRRLGMPGSVIALQWHPRINQILVGSGDRKAGQARILYSPLLSQRGAMLAVGRKPRPANPFDMLVASALPIYNPNALPMYREPMPGQRKRKTAESDAAENKQKHKPDLGSAAPGMGAGGKLGSTGGTLLTQYVLKTHGLLKNPLDEDVRASILRHAGK
ncbi:WD repeat-containing protein 70 [Auxenochlorella protothecoides]|uniref:WD repeat-containing protein 70 n=2 Tax=Auxenochlorella protothecoides TaxID=3075 RepID=A0A087SJ63_AUXPR|nr:WD repeat-containing protein 70 [Auxenochlorella protothecoides]KFM25767.1 WD repeat-containing protein 70 [Auxenochlorella protothecoides]